MSSPAPLTEKSPSTLPQGIVSAWRMAHRMGEEAAPRPNQNHFQFRPEDPVMVVVYGYALLSWFKMVEDGVTRRAARESGPASLQRTGY